jgi:CubicO group peptidase (beta-lactamase class C family)
MKSLQRWVAICCALLGASSGAAPAALARQDTLEQRLDAVISAAVAEHRIVGAVVLVARDGTVVYHRAAGLADREAGRPMHEDTIFNYSSVTKPIVTAAAMRLVEQRRIGLDDPVTRWLPDFKPKLADASTPVITVRQLLTHTAGLSYRFLEAPGSDYDRLNLSDGFDQPGLSSEEFLRRLGATQLRFPPGSGWKYSLSLDVLGLAMARATGTPLPQLIEQLVTRPLGMRDTGFRIADSSRASAYYVDHESQPVRMMEGTQVPLSPGVLRFAPDRLADPDSYPSGGAGMAGTAGDLLKFLEAMRKGGAPILKSSSVTDMMRVQAATPSATNPGSGFGFGWAVLVDPTAAKSPQSPGTISWGGVYGHTWFVDPARKLTVVAFTNTTLAGAFGPFPNSVRDAVYATNE